MKKKYGLSTAERLVRNSKTDLKTGCIEWALGIRKNGYAAISVGSRKQLAHRISYSTFRGHIPDNLFVCHTCDNKKCINPAHLFLGTHSNNMQDKVKKGRHIIGIQPNALTRKEITFALANRETQTQQQIATHLKRSQTTISKLFIREDLEKGKKPRKNKRLRPNQDIINRILLDTRPQDQIAKTYNTSQSTISLIKRGL